MDLKKKEKKKNIERQALETRRAKSRQRGEPEEESPNEDDGGDSDDDNDDSEGMASRLDRILEGPPQTDVDAPQMGAPKGGLAGLWRGNRGSHPHAALVLIPLPRLRKVGPFRASNLPLRQRRATGLCPWRRGR